MNRAADLACCVLAAPLLLPLHALIALAILLDDGGPVLFRQTRVGLQRRPFSICKFRTMRDGQITRVGAWLRRTGLDETAQVLNVLRGEMSWIGPRPLTPADTERLGWHRACHDPRYRLKPGMTGLAQLYGGMGAGWTRGIDRLYRQRRGPALDVWIAVWSVAINLGGKPRVRRYLARRRHGAGTQPSRSVQRPTNP